VRYHLVTFIIGAIAATGALLLAGPFDDGPWPVCQYEDGNIDGNECMWVNEKKVWYNDGSHYRN
jgi:hypothetical protein